MNPLERAARWLILLAAALAAGCQSTTTSVMHFRGGAVQVIEDPRTQNVLPPGLASITFLYDSQIDRQLDGTATLVFPSGKTLPLLPKSLHPYDISSMGKSRDYDEGYMNGMFIAASVAEAMDAVPGVLASALLDAAPSREVYRLANTLVSRNEIAGGGRFGAIWHFRAGWPLPLEQRERLVAAISHVPPPP